MYVVIKEEFIVRKKEEIALKLYSLPGMRFFVWITPWSRRLSMYQGDFSVPFETAQTFVSCADSEAATFTWGSVSRRIMHGVFCSRQSCLFCAWSFLPAKVSGGIKTIHESFSQVEVLTFKLKLNFSNFPYTQHRLGFDLDLKQMQTTG